MKSSACRDAPRRLARSDAPCRVPPRSDRDGRRRMDWRAGCRRCPVPAHHRPLHRRIDSGDFDFGRLGHYVERCHRSGNVHRFHSHLRDRNDRRLECQPLRTVSMTADTGSDPRRSRSRRVSEHARDRARGCNPSRRSCPSPCAPPEQLRYALGSFAALESEQRGVHLRQPLSRFGAEQIRVALRVHLPEHPLNRFEHAARLERLDGKSFAPA